MILILEFAPRPRHEGAPLLEAAREAARIRFRPVLMTAFSFILGDGTPYPQHGVVDCVDPTIEATRGTITVRAVVPNPDGVQKARPEQKVVAKQAGQAPPEPEPAPDAKRP